MERWCGPLVAAICWLACCCRRLRFAADAAGTETGKKRRERWQP